MATILGYVWQQLVYEDVRRRVAGLFCIIGNFVVCLIDLGLFVYQRILRF